jgi:hypothetical protein
MHEDLLSLLIIVAVSIPLYLVWKLIDKWFPDRRILQSPGRNLTRNKWSPNAFQ